MNEDQQRVLEDMRSKTEQMRRHAFESWELLHHTQERIAVVLEHLAALPLRLEGARPGCHERDTG